MPLLRSGSARSTLSTITRRATAYQKYLNLINVFLIITSTVLIFSAIILIKFYHLDKFGFWDPLFEVVPLYMICLGVFTFIVCFFGFAVTATENRGLLVTFAVVLVIVFLAQLGSIFTAFELRTQIDAGVINNIANDRAREELKKYGNESTITNKWDELQKDIHCCGYDNWNNYRISEIEKHLKEDRMVPDSCCIKYEEGCAKGTKSKGESELLELVNLNGCVELMELKMTGEVKVMMIIYAIIGVILALIELISVVLTSAFVAQITRKLNKEPLWRTGDAGYDQAPQDETDDMKLTAAETVC